jgi:hydroxymethylglutaryl-CoA synthase
MKIGIIGYGTYIPRFRITIDEIAKANNEVSKKIHQTIAIKEKSVHGKDEDSVTMAICASQNALKRTNLKPESIEAIYIGSESHPYSVKPSATIIGQALGIGNNYLAADMEFACKSGTAALQVCAGVVSSNICNYAIAIGSDTAQAKPGSILEYTSAAGSAAFIIGKNPPEWCASIDKTISISSNTPDFWRRNRQKYPTHAGRFTANPSFFQHTMQTTQQILKIMNMKTTDFDHVVFHQPNGKFPIIAAKKLGFSSKQFSTSLLVSEIGNTYSASSLLGLSAILDEAKPNQKILLVSYGSGSGSDAFIISTTNRITRMQKKAQKVKCQISMKKYILYSEYRKNLKMIC